MRMDRDALDALKVIYGFIDGITHDGEALPVRENRHVQPIYGAEVLQHRMYERRSSKRHSEVEHLPTVFLPPNRFVRDVRDERTPPGEPQGPQSTEQCAIQPHDLVHILSHQMAPTEWRRSLEAAGSLSGLWRTIKSSQLVQQALPEVLEAAEKFADWEGCWIAATLCHLETWPAGKGPFQHPFEPPRLAAGVPHRAAQIKALGNGCLPQQMYLILKPIADELRKERR